MTPTDMQIGGWKTLDSLGQSAEEMLSKRRRERDDQVALFGAVFGSEAGRKVLDILKDMTVGRPMIPDAVKGQAAVSFDQIAPYVTFRSGQNAIVERIVQILAEAERGPAQPRGK